MSWPSILSMSMNDEDKKDQYEDEGYRDLKNDYLEEEEKNDCIN